MVLEVSAPPIKGRVIWITGLPGSGKTTLAKAIIDLYEKSNLKYVSLDGDELRNVLIEPNFVVDSYSKDNRLKLARIYSRFCKYLSDQGLDVIISTVSLFKEIHKWNRFNIERYLEIFIDAPNTLLLKRDQKGLYSGFSRESISDVMSLDIEVDFPVNPDKVILASDNLEVQKVAQEIFKLKVRSLLIHED
jgi:adenylylsulfate kinase-like enzyme